MLTSISVIFSSDRFALQVPIDMQKNGIHTHTALMNVSRQKYGIVLLARWLQRAGTLSSLESLTEVST